MKFGDERLPERFWAKVEVTETDCWMWTAATNGKYAKFFLGKVDGKTKLVFAHRHAYETLVGPIEPGLVIDHLCRNRLCVKPEHLEPVTHQVNLLRGDTITARNAAVTHCPHGHEYTPDNTYQSANGRKCRSCHLSWCERRRRARGVPKRNLTSSPERQPA